jgi:hypothetical protein
MTNNAVTSQAIHPTLLAAATTFLLHIPALPPRTEREPKPKVKPRFAEQILRELEPEALSSGFAERRATGHTAAAAR